MSGQQPAAERRTARLAWIARIAEAYASIADCSRRQVACVIFDPVSWHIATMGYNGRAAGLPGCATAGACPRGQSDVVARTAYLRGGAGSCDAVHAEDNALRRARERSLDVAGMEAFVTHEPCDGCLALLRHYAISRVVWPTGSLVLSGATAPIGP